MNDEVSKRVEEIGSALRDAEIGVPMPERRPFYERHQDDPWFDAVMVDTVPRYKTSGLSGDEWRFSYRVRLARKGLVLYERSFGSFDFAVGAIPYFKGTAGEGGQEDYKVHDYDAKMKALESKCANPGCTNDAVSEYRFKKEWCKRCGQPHEDKYSEHRIKFCQRHLRRGDCGLHDADDNYEVVKGPGPEEARGYGEDISESAFGGFINL